MRGRYGLAFVFLKRALLLVCCVTSSLLLSGTIIFVLMPEQHHGGLSSCKYWRYAYFVVYWIE